MFAYNCFFLRIVITALPLISDTLEIIISLALGVNPSTLILRRLSVRNCLAFSV